MDRTYGISEVPEIARAIFDQLEDISVVTLEGDLGAGKTTLLKELGLLLKLENEVSSPSYSIVNEYTTADKQVIYHFDLYRLKTIAELYDLGFLEYIESGNLCFIEWPEMAKPLLPLRKTCNIKIKHLHPEKRRIEVNFS